MKLDFTNLSSEYTKRLNEIAEEIRVDYTQFVDECCQKFDNYLFWATPFASRNTYNDDSFLNISRLLLAKELVDSDAGIDCIITETKGEYLALNGEIDPTITIRFAKKGYYRNILRKIINRWYGFASYIRQHLAYIRYADKEFDYPEYVSIVIGPAISTDFDGYRFNDRYTTGIFDYHDGLFFPYIVNTQHIPDRVMFDRIKNCSNYKFLYDRSLARVLDLCNIIEYWQYINIVKKEKYTYKGIDVSPLIKQSLEIGKNNPTTFDGLIMRRMIERLAKKGVKVLNFIQWYEGRPFDILVSSAIRKHFKDVNCVGYEGYPLPESLLGCFISEYQNNSGYSPNKMAISSMLYEKNARLFCEDVKLLYVPIVRNDYVIKNNRNNSNKTILILMSYETDTAIELIEGINRFISENGNDYQVLIKNHPTNIGFTLKEYGITDVSFSPHFVEGKLSDCLEDVDIVITSVTTSTLEVLFAGVHLIILYPRGKLGYSSLPGDLRNKLCRIVFSPEEIASEVKKCSKLPEIDNSILSGFFVEKTEQSVLQLFET